MNIAIETYRQKAVHKDVVVSLQYSPSGQYLVSADQSGGIVIWPRGTRRGSRRIQSPYAPLTGAWFSEDEKWIIAGHQGGRVGLFSLPKGKLEARIQLKTEYPEGTILSGTSRAILNSTVLAFSPANNRNLYVALEWRDFFTLQRPTMEVTGHVH